MAAKCLLRGWVCYYDGTVWRWLDSDEPITEDRPCRRCDYLPFDEGYDACLGCLPGIKLAYCGCGEEESFVIFWGNENEILQ